MEVTLSKALKIKNRLISEVQDLQSKIREYNQVHEDNFAPFNVEEMLNELQATKEKLVTLKTNIHNKCEPIRNNIFKISELKDTLKFLSEVPTKSGMVKSHSYSQEMIPMKSYISSMEMDKHIKTIRAEIEDLQDTIDVFNAKTTILV